MLRDKQKRDFIRVNLFLLIKNCQTFSCNYTSVNVLEEVFQKLQMFTERMRLNSEKIPLW